MVAAPVRSGDQRQQLGVLAPLRSDLSSTRVWVLENLGEPITVQQLADRSHLPRRTFIRHFEAETGQSPMRWVSVQRVLAPRRLLEESDWSVERVATVTGFGTAANFRTEGFRREVGTTPSAYRRAAAKRRAIRDGLTSQSSRWAHSSHWAIRYFGAVRRHASVSSSSTSSSSASSRVMSSQPKRPDSHQEA